MYSETFAGLVQAALDAGVPGEIIEELEAAGICSNESARSALREGKCSDLLSAHLRAITLIAFGHLAACQSCCAQVRMASPCQGRQRGEGTCQSPVQQKVARSTRQWSQRRRRIVRAHWRSSDKISGREVTLLPGTPGGPHGAKNMRSLADPTRAADCGHGAHGRKFFQSCRISQRKAVFQPCQAGTYPADARSRPGRR